MKRVPLAGGKFPFAGGFRGPELPRSFFNDLAIQASAELTSGAGVLGL
jgi:hypothetical protein